MPLGKFFWQDRKRLSKAKKIYAYLASNIDGSIDLK